MKKTSTIVELGGGTGSLTKKILASMGENSSLFCLELNETFYQGLSKSINDPRFHIIKGSAEKLRKHMEMERIMQVDCIISSLPLSNIPTNVKKQILLNCKQLLKASGQFIQYQYTLKDRKLVQEFFTSCKLDFVLINIPPAFIYSCKNT